MFQSSAGIASNQYSMNHLCAVACEMCTHGSSSYIHNIMLENDVFVDSARLDTLIFVPERTGKKEMSLLGIYGRHLEIRR